MFKPLFSGNFIEQHQRLLEIHEVEFMLFYQTIQLIENIMGFKAFVKIKKKKQNQKILYGLIRLNYKDPDCFIILKKKLYKQMSNHTTLLILFYNFNVCATMYIL